MPHEYEDNEDREPPYNANVAFEQGVDASGGYTVPVPADYTLRGYKSTAVRIDGHGSIITVEVGWTHSGDGASIVTIEEKVQLTSDPSVLLFVNQGDVLDHVTLTGGGNVDYSVVESNQLPLPELDSASFATYFNLGGEPGLIDPVSFTGTNVYAATPNFQLCELFSFDTTDTSVFGIDATNRGALLLKEGMYVVYGGLAQADDPAPGLPIQGLLAMKFTDGLGGGNTPGLNQQNVLPMAQGYMVGQARDLTFVGLLNTYVYHEDSPPLDFLPVLVQLFYAPGVATDVIHGNWRMSIFRLTHGDINLFI